MILKCTRNICSESLSVHRLYPVIAYEIDADIGAKQYQIVDDCRSLSWISIDFFEIISARLEDYIKLNNNGKNPKYVHKHITGKDFFVNYYSEDEKSLAANNQLIECLISILSRELPVNILMQNLCIVGYGDDSADLLLKAFFLKAKRKDVLSFAKNIYSIIGGMNSYIIHIIVENLFPYKHNKIENLFMKLYLDGLLCNEDTIDMINKYLGI